MPIERVIAADAPTDPVDYPAALDDTYGTNATAVDDTDPPVGAVFGWSLDNYYRYTVGWCANTHLRCS